VTHVAADWPVFWERAAGVNVWDADGNRYLDLTGAFAVAGLGHGRREVVEAMTRQAAKLLHGMGDVHPTSLKGELCAQLSALTFERWGAGAGKTVLSNSGFEAVESALKTAVLATGRHGVLAFEGGYHGLGYGALLPTGFPKFRDPFAAQLAPISDWLPFPRNAEDLVALRVRLDELEGKKIGAVVVEPMQGRGGIVIPPPGFLALLREWCDAHGAILIFDEIFTGFNRTGRLFACEHEQVVPDLVCLGKAMSGGFPISACVGRAAVMDAWPESTGEALHTSTFLGHPVGCAMALEAVRLHREPATRQAVHRVDEAMAEALGAIESPHVAEVRGRGAMWGIELRGAAGRDLAGAVTNHLLRRGVLILPGGLGGNVLTLTPPFEISETEIAFASRMIAEALEGASCDGAL
jgi:4-aminobutyrate aminotransferase-like enzyme